LLHFYTPSVKIKGGKGKDFIGGFVWIQFYKRSAPFVNQGDFIRLEIKKNVIKGEFFTNWDALALYFL